MGKVTIPKYSITHKTIKSNRNSNIKKLKIR
jgi:hypothetical protein